MTIHKPSPTLSYLLAFSLGLLYGLPLPGQEFVYRDHAYVPSIKSVVLGVPGLQTAYPILQLGTGRLLLEFDEIGVDSRYLRYRITHHNRDWSKSDLEDLEFLEGFNEEELRDFAFSVNTRTPYVHYWLNLPNQQARWTKSGNYMIHVYDEDTGQPLVSRRFMVVENLMRVSGQIDRPSNVSKIRSHHEIDFVVNHKDIRISNPRQEIRAAVLQNGRWDNAVVDIEPFLERPEELVFDFQDRVVFGAGKEFRHVDIRTLRSPSIDVLEIEEFEDAFEVRMKKDKKRAFHNYLSDQDLNGNFVIFSHDDDDFAVEADYAYVIFSLDSPQPMFDHDVYLMGAFTNWAIDDAYKMEYQERYSIYTAEALLKQGVYDYVYGAVSKESGEVDIGLLEGNWHETENYYTILVYYRPFGERYDRLVAVTTLSEK